MHRFANPARFLKTARSITRWLLAIWGLQDRAAYFVTPSAIAAGTILAEHDERYMPAQMAQPAAPAR